MCAASWPACLYPFLFCPESCGPNIGNTPDNRERFAIGSQFAWNRPFFDRDQAKIAPSRRFDGAARTVKPSSDYAAAMMLARRWMPACLTVAVLGSLARPTHGQGDSTIINGLRLESALVINRVGRGGRSPIQTDAVQHLLATGRWRTPTAGDSVALADGSTRSWSKASVNENGVLLSDQMPGGYALWTVDSPDERIMLLNARGHGMVYVNGEPRMGDPYDNGTVSVPVRLRAGVNEFLFHCPRGPIRAELVKPRAGVMLSTSDVTAPDFVRGGTANGWGGVMVINATDRPLRDLAIRCTHEGRPAATVVGQSVPPLSVRKCRFLVQPLPENIDATISTRPITLTLLQGDGTDGDPPLDTATLDLKVVNPLDLHRMTFRSEIDGSAQYCAVRRALRDDPEPAIILTLHGASVEAYGQAAAYASKDWAHIVAPTNRRPFGFDWEDWGRIDAIEVLTLARKHLPHDGRRVYLTGHSMGGHGTWQVGATYPGAFAAIAPSAGWISFESYGGGRARETSDEDDPIRRLINRAANPSRTLELQRNLEGLGVYILHGENDDNVPVEQARTMKQQLAWHADMQYHEQPGAGHWWGNECVDWPPLMEFLRAHARPGREALDQVRFVTASPGVSASREWVTIEQQVHPMAFSSVDLTRDRAKRSITGTTENVARLAIDVSEIEGDDEIVVNIDGKEVRAHASPQAARRMLFLQRSGDGWVAASDALGPAHKTPARCGPFKSAFNHRMMFVYGTTGTPEENAWALAKARFDAEAFWYRGNGSVDVVADRDYDAASLADLNRSVILYGNADSNGAWHALLKDSPVQVRRGRVTVDERTIDGHDLAAYFVRPKPGSNVASVGVVSGTGLPGMRLADRAPYFVSGAAYPDCLVVSADVLLQEDDAVRCAGFFGNDWSVAGGDFAWRD
jgi:dienelactone hydrolase